MGWGVSIAFEAHAEGIGLDLDLWGGERGRWVLVLVDKHGTNRLYFDARRVWLLFV